MRVGCVSVCVCCILYGAGGVQKVGTHFNYSCLTAVPIDARFLPPTQSCTVALCAPTLFPYISLSLSFSPLLFLKHAWRRIYHKFFFASPRGNYEIFQLPDIVSVSVWNWNWFAGGGIAARLPDCLLLLPAPRQSLWQRWRCERLRRCCCCRRCCLCAQSFISFEPPGGNSSSVLCFVINTNTHTKHTHTHT